MARLAGLLVGGFLAMGVAPLAFAQGSPFNCDVVFYQIRNNAGVSQILKFASVSSTVTPTAVYGANQPTQLNSIGYNPVDNYLYGIRAQGAEQPQLYRIGTTGYQQIGTVTTSLVGGTALSAAFVPTGGVFDAAGRYYFVGQNTNIVPAAVFRIDSIPLTGPVPIAHQYNLITVTPPITSTITNFGDFDFNGAGGPDGLLLASVNTNHYRIALQQNPSNPAQGTASVSVVPLNFTGPPTTTTVGGIGSAFYDAFVGKFYVFNNTDSNFFEITNPQLGAPSAVPTPAVTYPPFPAGNPTDGTSCPISGTRVANLGIFKTDGVSSVPAQAVTSYTLTVTNAGPYPANYAVVRDPAVAGLTKLSVTCAAPGGPPSAVCPPTLSLTSLEAGVQVITFPPGTTLLFTVNAQVTAAAGTNVTNTATVTPALDTTDPNLANNVSVDVDAVSATTTTVVSAAAMCPVGTVETYVNLISNGDFAAAAPLTSEAAIGGLNTYNVSNSVSRQTGTQVYFPPSNGIQQNQFPGDAGRSVSGAETWLLSNGKAGAANYRVWTQAVTGLTAGRVYEFMTYVSNATRPGTTSPTLPDLRLQVGTGAATSTLAAFSPANEAALAGDRWTLVQGSFTATVTSATLTIANFAPASAEPAGGDVAAIAQVTLRACTPSADVAVTKTNNTGTLVSLGTTAYTITVSNASAITATNTLIVDPGVANLAKTTITCVVSGANLCPASISIPGFEGSGLVIPRVTSGGGTVVFTVQANVTGPPGSTATNIVTVSGIDYTDSNPANNQAQDSDPIVGSANLSVTKTNTVTTLVSGNTTSYSITVSNSGPATVANAVLTDVVQPGLSCTSVTCTAVIGASSCPVAGSTTIAALQGAGISLPSMGVPSSIIFQVFCSVTATGS